MINNLSVTVTKAELADLVNMLELFALETELGEADPMYSRWLALHDKLEEQMCKLTRHITTETQRLAVEEEKANE